MLLSQIERKTYQSECEIINPQLASSKKKEDEGENETVKEEIKINVYPNPARDQLNINVNLQDGVAASFQVYNFAGILVYGQTLTTKNTVLSTKDLSAGVYFYKVVIDDKEEKLDKLIIIK